MHVQSSGYSYFGFGQDPRYKVVTNLDELQEAENALKRSKVHAFDTETEGLAWWKGDRICGHCWATRPDGGEIQSYYIPIRHRTGQSQLPAEVVTAFSKQFLEDTSTTTICHNIKFDEHMAHQDGMQILGRRIDTLIEARFFAEDRDAGLKERAFTDLQDPNAKMYDELLQLELARLAKWQGMNKTEYLKEFGYSGIDIWLCGMYASRDADMTLRLHEFYESKGVSEYYGHSPRTVEGRELMSVYDTEMELTRVLCDVERIGVQLDVDRIHKMHAVLEREKARAEAEFFKTTGLEYFNLGSDDQLRETLMGYFGCKLTKLTKSGNLAVDSDVIGEFTKGYPVLSWVLRYKDVDKKLTTYSKTLLEFCDEHGVVHGDFQQVGTNTGRLSCRRPNLQNLPAGIDAGLLKDLGFTDEEIAFAKEWEDVKKIFIVQRNPNSPSLRELLGDTSRTMVRTFLDYSQVELRVMAHYTQDPRMVKTYLNDGDIHDEVELAVFGTGRTTEAGDINRRKAKVINFGLSYCMSAIGYARQLKATEQEGQEAFDEFNRKFPRVKLFREGLYGYIRAQSDQGFRNMFGRSRRLPDIISGYTKDRKRAERQAIGTLIQGTAAELTKLSMVLVDRWLRANNLTTRQVETVHDEIQLDGPAEEFSMVARGVKEIMEDFPDFIVPIKVEGEWSTTTWAAKKAIPGL